MKQFIICFIIALFIFGCETNSNTVKTNQDINYREEMRTFVEKISLIAKKSNPNFIIIPQNGHNLLTDTGLQSGKVVTNYIDAIDGVGREDLFYGYNNDNLPTPTQENEEMIQFMNIAKNNGIIPLITDYCSTHSKMDDSYSKNNSYGYLSFAADHRSLDDIPSYPDNPYNENSDDIENLNDAKNFLYLINPQEFSSAQEFVNSVSNTNYDIIIMDYFFLNNTEFTDLQITQLKQKKNGAKRLIIAYMSIGEAEEYRYYWQTDWEIGNPQWLLDETPNWEGNYKVKYWNSEWQDIICASNGYLSKILSKGFDGVYLDIIDAFEYFESRKI